MLLIRIASFPASVLGPVESPPCNLHRPFLALSNALLHTGGAWQSVPLRVFALQTPRAFLGVLQKEKSSFFISFFKYFVICLPLKTIPHDARSRVLGRKLIYLSRISRFSRYGKKRENPHLPAFPAPPIRGGKSGRGILK